MFAAILQQLVKILATKMSVLRHNLCHFLLLLLGGLSIILGVYADVGALVLVAVLLVMAVKMHNFWSKTDEHAQGAFWKNVSMAGAAFFFFALVANGGDFGPVLSDDLLSLFSDK